jgi:RNA polymerase sigma-70 factor, ECF subfamily
MSKKQLGLQTIALNFIDDKSNNNFRELINRLRPGIVSFAYKYVKDRDLANEVSSRVFITIWKKIDQYKTQYNFSTWAYAIAKNEALGMLRNKNKTISLDKCMAGNSKFFQSYNPSFSMDTECMGPQGEDIIDQLYDASISAIKQLDQPYQAVMIEREINKKPLSDIADDLGWNLSTVKTRLRKARKDVADVLQKQYPSLVDSYFTSQNED